MFINILIYVWSISFYIFWMVLNKKIRIGHIVTLVLAPAWYIFKMWLSVFTQSIPKELTEVQYDFLYPRCMKRGPTLLSLPLPRSSTCIYPPGIYFFLKNKLPIYDIFVMYFIHSLHKVTQNKNLLKIWPSLYIIQRTSFQIA